jgi:hypothetical protein
VSAGDRQSAAAEIRALAFVEGVAAIGFAEFHRRNGPEPVAREVRAAIFAALPEPGGARPDESRTHKARGSAATRLTRDTERTAARILTSRQVSLERRIAFIKQVDTLLERRR